MLVTLEEGQYFGASNILDNLAKSPVSAYASKDCHLMVVDEQAYRNLEESFLYRIKWEQYNFMRDINLFKKLSRPRVHKMGQEFKPEQIIRGQYLFREKEPADFVYIIKSGEFKITKELIVPVEEI